jgi:AcrR family transcriptional regulator
VISATGLSKGAFYHHFRSKEDLLEAITNRFVRESVGFIASLQTDPKLDALKRLNLLLALGREWKREHIAELKAMFTTLLNPQNALLYHRIIDAVAAVLAPALAQIIAEGEAEGVFDAGDPRVAADTLLWLSNGRRGSVMAALAMAETDVEAGLNIVVERVRAEERITNRVLGLPAGGVDLLGSEAVVRDMLVGWNAAGAKAVSAASEIVAPRSHA